MDELFNNVHENVSSLIKDRGAGVDMVPAIISTAMEHAEANQKWTGEEKCQAVLTTVSRVLKTLNDDKILNDELYFSINGAVQVLGPAIIALVCEASKGLIAINERYFKGKKCCIVN